MVWDRLGITRRDGATPEEKLTQEIERLKATLRKIIGQEDITPWLVEENGE
jgi:hypothetical protein